MSNVLASNQLSNIPWRRLGVKYTNNEAYFDLIEEIDAIIDRNGTTIMCEIQGYVSAAPGHRLHSDGPEFLLPSCRER